MSFSVLKSGFMVFGHVFCFFVQTLTNEWINRNHSIKKRRRSIEMTHQRASRVLKNLKVQIKIHFEDQFVKDSFSRVNSSNYFMVCNHMSYLDILILTSIHPSVFISSVEMKKTFLLGDLAKLGGTFFVDRRNRRQLGEEVRTLVNIINQGFDVFLFPEGTSTNGQEILPFKKSLFRVPFQTDFPILPICLKYSSIDGEPFSADNCDRVCWYDEMSFFPHVLQLLSLKKLEVEVHYMEPLSPGDFKTHGDLSQRAENKIRSVYTDRV